MSLMLLYHILTVHVSGTRPLRLVAAGFSLGSTRAFIWASCLRRDLESRDCVNTSHFLGCSVRLTGPELHHHSAHGNLMEMMSALTAVQFFSTPVCG